MSKYIKLEDAMDLAKTGRLVSNGNYESVCKALESLPTIEIVRCKDCKHYNFETHGCKRSPSVERWLGDDFCSYGEKQVASKLNNTDDSLLTEDTEGCKEQKSKLESDLISRQAAIEALTGWQTDPTDEEIEHTLKALPVEPKPVCEDAISKRFIQDSLLHRISHLNAQGEKAIGTARELIQFKKFVDGITPVVPGRKKGEWIDREQCQVDEDAYDVATCSNCKAEITLEYPKDNFCPNCGCRMIGDDGNDNE